MDNFYNASTEEALSLIESIAKGRDAMTGPMAAAIKQIRLNTRKADCHEELVALTPPAGYRLYTLDASIKGRWSIMFELLAKDDWHLQGEVLNAAGEDIREPLYVTRQFIARATNHQESGERK